MWVILPFVAITIRCSACNRVVCSKRNSGYLKCAAPESKILDASPFFPAEPATILGNGFVFKLVSMEEEEAGDRFLVFPDEIVVNILFYVPVASLRNSVRLVSRRWYGQIGRAHV